MHIRNHSRPLMVLLSLFIFCSQVFAEEYAELSACRLHFQTVVQPGATDIASMDNWCLKTAKMDPLTVCADKKLYSFMATNSINNDQKTQQREIFRQDCSREQSSQVAGSTQTLQNASTTTSSTAPAGAVIADKAGVTYTQPTVAGAPRQPILNLQQIKECAGVTNLNACEVAKQAAIKENNLAGAAFANAQSTYARDLAAFDTQQKNAENQAAAQRQQVQQATAQVGVQAVASALGAVGSSSSSSGSSATNSGSASSSAVNSSSEGAGSAALNGSAAVDPANLDAQARALTNGQANLPSNVSPDAALSSEAPATTISQQVDQQIQQLVQQIETQQATVTTLAAPLTAPAVAPTPFAQFSTAFTTVKESIGRQTSGEANSTAQNAYHRDLVQKKLECKRSAERAEKFCLEGSSPGMKFAKGLIDYSGPVLALIRSAHKACSNTAKVANLATLGVTLAKGVCVATKLKCDTACADTKVKSTEIQTQLRSSLVTALQTDRDAANASCLAAYGTPLTAAGLAPCQAQVTANVGKGMQVIQTLTQALEREQGLEEGSTQSLVNHCASKTKDIALMATNLLGLVAMRGSAEKCEKQLAAAGGGATGGATSADYCSVAANTSTQFCKCQGTPNAEGCGAVLAGGVPEASSSNQIGANLKTGSGLSNFAGGTGGGSSGSGSDFGIGSEGRAATGLAADLNGTSSLGAGLGGAGGAGVGGGGAGGGAGGDPNAAAAGAKDEKKSPFGSLAGLANSLGGMFGGGRGGAAAGNGALSSQQQAAIQRKLASDKIAGEVTSSSGLDNFSKIKKSYGQKAETFMTAP